MIELMPPFYFLTFAKVSVSVSKKFGLRKVAVSVSKTFGLKKKSRYRSQKYLVSKKSLGLGLKNFGLEKSLGIGLDEIFWSRHSVFFSRMTLIIILKLTISCDRAAFAILAIFV